jgi:hypothetical protein
MLGRRRPHIARGETRSRVLLKSVMWSHQSRTLMGDIDMRWTQSDNTRFPQSHRENRTSSQTGIRTIQFRVGKVKD